MLPKSWAYYATAELQLELLLLTQVSQTFLIASKQILSSSSSIKMMVRLLRPEQTSPIKNSCSEISCSEILRLSWWLEVKTVVPPCVYYFGPFSSQKEAQISQYHYIDDLSQKKAHGITAEVKQLQPKELMIYED